MRRREAFTKAIFPKLSTDLRGAEAEHPQAAPQGGAAQ
jgi:hypothetical protein